MILLQQLTWYNVAFVALGGATGGGLIILALLKWARFKPMDNANVEEKKAKVRQIEAAVDISISSEALKVVSSLREQLNGLTKYQNEMQIELDKERRAAQEARRRAEEAEERMGELQRLLDEEKEKCRQMAIEFEQLKVKLERFEKGRPF